MQSFDRPSSRRPRKFDGNARRRFQLACEALEARCLMTLGDSGFEQIPVGAGNWAYRPAGSAWTFSSSGSPGDVAGLSGNGSAFTSGNPGAPQGGQVAVIQAHGTITQSVAGWAAGTYSVSFQAAHRGNWGGVEDFEVTVDGQPVGVFKPATTAYRTYTTPAFAVTAGTHTVAFVGLDSAGGDNTAFVDAVSLAQATTVPSQPSTTTAMISGAPATDPAGTAITLTGSATDTSAAMMAAGFTYAWSVAKNGAAFANGTGPTFTFTPDAAGTFLVSLVATNSLGNSSVPATATIGVTAAGAVPAVPQEPLLHQADLQYVGAFRVPNYYDSGGEMSYSAGAVAFNSANNSLFIVGTNGAISEVAIPGSIVNSSNLGSLATATVLQNWTNPLAGLPNPLVGATDGVRIGGLIVDSGKLIGTEYAYYSGANTQATSHFVINSLNLATATVSGLYQIGNTPGARYVAGAMAAIPPEWQSALGHTYLTGLSDTTILSTISSGPAAFGFDPGTLGSGSVAATPYLYYPVGTPLGAYDGPANPMQSGTTQVAGMVFPGGTNSILYFGRTGTNSDGYGEPSAFGDPYDAGKGPHSLNGEYALQVWAYSATDLLAVKQGTKQPWQVLPYDVWNFTLPYDNTGEHTIGTPTFDPATGRVYVPLLNADSAATSSTLPLIEVFQVNVPSGTQSPAAPQVGTLAVTPSTLAPGAIPAGTSATLTAGNVYAITPGASIASVAFYLDTNNTGTLDVGTDQLLGLGTGASNMPDGSSTNWTLTIDTTGMAPGKHRVIAQATDSYGRTSNAILATFQIQ
jgi:hypothetical protein